MYTLATALRAAYSYRGYSCLFLIAALLHMLLVRNLFGYYILDLKKSTKLDGVYCVVLRAVRAAAGRGLLVVELEGSV